MHLVSSRALPEPIRLGGPARAYAATHDHAPCLGCAHQQTAISRLEHDLRYARGRVAELEYQIDRMSATPEMGRRNRTFEE